MSDFLSKLPFDGYKTYICIGAAAVVLGLSQLGYVDPALAERIAEWIALAGGFSLVHKIDKAI